MTVKYSGSKFGAKKYADYAWTTTGATGDHISYFLLINGVSVSGWIPIRLRLEISSPCFFDFELDEKWDQPSAVCNQTVELREGSRTIFKGRIINYDSVGQSGQMGVTYHAVDYVYMLQNVPYKKSGQLLHVINPQIGEVEYGVSQEDVNCGEILKDILDNSTLTGIVTGYVQSELDGMDIEPPRIELAGATVYDAIMSVLNFQFDYGFYIDENQIIHFLSLKKADLTDCTIDFSSVQKEGVKIKPDISNCITSVNIQGRYERETVDYIEWDNARNIVRSSMNPAWDRARETSWTPTLSDDDPTREDDGQVYRYFQLSHTNLLPNLLYSQSGITILEFNPSTGASGNWTEIGGKVNLKTGILALTSPAWTTYESAYIPNDIMIRYAYVDTANPPEISTAHAGTAYTSCGWTKVFPVFDPEFKKQEVKGIVTETASGKIYDATGNFSEDYIGKSISGNEITDCEEGWIEVAGSWTVNDEYTINFRDDTASSVGMSKIASAIVSMLGDIQYVGEVCLDGLDTTTYHLGQKINLSNTLNSDLASMNAPLRAITYNFQQYQTILALTSGYYTSNPLNYDELKRRLANLKGTSKASAWVDITSASSSAGNSGGASGSQTIVAAHDHSDANSGGHSLNPKVFQLNGYYLYSTGYGAKLFIPSSFALELGENGSSETKKPAGLNRLYGDWK